MIPPPPFSALTFIKIDFGLFIGSQDCICKVLKHLTNAAVSFEGLPNETAEFFSKIKERLGLKTHALLKKVVGMIPPPVYLPKADQHPSKDIGPLGRRQVVG